MADLRANKGNTDPKAPGSGGINQPRTDDGPRPPRGTSKEGETPEKP